MILTSKIGLAISTPPLVVIGLANALGYVPRPRGQFSASTRTATTLAAGTRQAITYRAGNAG